MITLVNGSGRSYRDNLTLVEAQRNSDVSFFFSGEGNEALKYNIACCDVHFRRFSVVDRAGLL